MNDMYSEVNNNTVRTHNPDDGMPVQNETNTCYSPNIQTYFDTTIVTDAASSIEYLDSLRRCPLVDTEKNLQFLFAPTKFYQYGYRRVMVVGWMNELANDEAFGKDFRVCQLAVNIFDRISSVMDIRSDNCQKIALTCTWIAAKFLSSEFKMGAKELTSFAENLCTHSELKSIEVDILNSIEHRLVVPLTHHYVEAYIEIFNLNDSDAALYKFIALSSILDYYLQFLDPKIIALASLLVLARIIQRDHFFTLATKELSSANECNNYSNAYQLFTAQRAILQNLKNFYSAEIDRFSNNWVPTIRYKHHSELEDAVFGSITFITFIKTFSHPSLLLNIKIN